MLTPETNQKLALGMAVIRDLQDRGKIPPPPYSLRDLAEICEVSQSTILQLERLSRAKLCAKLLRDPHLPPATARRLARCLSDLTSNPTKP
jgi:hypothetical protein